jgi:hypothetical protein
MNHILAKVKGPRKNPFFKLISDQTLFENINIDVVSCVEYSPDHNLDEDAWFKIAKFTQMPFCIDLLKNNFDSKDYDDLNKTQFGKISYLFSVQDENFYFQKITPSLFILKKTLTFGEIAKVEESDNRLVINSIPDAGYLRTSDTLIFRNLATISSMFPGIDQLYKEATKEEVEQFLGESFIELNNGYNLNSVSKPNRKRIALAMETLSTMSDDDKSNILYYIENYCINKLKFDKENSKFKISTDDELKLLLYGIEQRFYTTPFGKERRLANSVQALD